MTERFIEDDKGHLYREDEHGNRVLVRDLNTYQEKKEDTSHLGFFKKRKTMTNAQAKHRLRQQDMLTERFEQLVTDRVDPGFHPDVQQLTDEQYEEMQLNSKFNPLHTYVHKLQTSSGAIVRPVLKGEVGMIGPTIFVLEAGYSQPFTGADLEDNDGTTDKSESVSRETDKGGH